MKLTPFARKVLNLHADQPDRMLYGVDALGSSFTDAGIDRLNEAYEELERAGLVQVMDERGFLGWWVKLYQITETGYRLVKEAAA